MTVMKKETGKKLLIIYILQILRRESDSAHPLSQQRILELLEERYGMTVDRKSVRRNLLCLREAGFPVKESGEVRRTIRGKDASVTLGWYWAHALSAADAEQLRALLAFSPLPAQRARQLADTVCSFTSRHAAGMDVRNLPRPDVQEGEERQRETVRLLAAAVSGKRKVSFYCGHYEADGKYHRDRDPQGEEKKRKVNPYAVIAAGHRYFLLGNDDGGEAVSIWPAERMSEAEILEEPARPERSLAALESGVTPGEWIDVTEGVFCGPPEICTLDAAPEALTELMETFGKRARVLSATMSAVQMEVTASLPAVEAWALRQGGRVKVTGPPRLVRAMKEKAAALAAVYGGS